MLLPGGWNPGARKEILRISPGFRAMGRRGCIFFWPTPVHMLWWFPAPETGDWVSKNSSWVYLGGLVGQVTVNMAHRLIDGGIGREPWDLSVTCPMSGVVSSCF